MYPFGHLGITIFLGTLLRLPMLFLAIGALLPDIVDKVFFELDFLPCGRSFAHNLFFGPLLAALVFLVTRRRNISLALLFGSYLHLIGDIRNFIPWFYPFVSYNFVCLPTTFRIDAFIIITESIGIVLLAATFLFKAKIIYLQKRLSNRLKHYGIGRAGKKVRIKKR